MAGKTGTGRVIKRTITADPELWNDAKVYCAKNKISMSELIGTLLRKDLERKK